MFALVDRPSSQLDKPSEITRGAAARLSWAWNGLVFAVPFHIASYEGLRDVVSNVLPTTVNLLAWTRDTRGNTCASLQDTAYLEFPGNGVAGVAHDLPSRELTVYCRIKKVGNADSGAAMLSHVYADVTQPWVSWTMGDTSAFTGKLDGAIYTSANVDVPIETIDSNVFTTAEWVSAFMRWRTGSTVRLDVLGERGQPLTGINSSSTVGGTITYAANKGIRVNASDDVTANYKGYYSQCMVWSRRLTDTEMTSLVQDPFGWYSPRRETVLTAGPFPVFARSGPNVLRDNTTPPDVISSGPYVQPTSATQLFYGG